MLVEYTYAALLFVQAAHLLHHRIVRRQISYVEGITGLILCINPLRAPFPDVLAGIHIVAIIIQISGSIYIRKLSPPG